MQMRQRIVGAAIVFFLLLVVGTCAAALDPSKHIKQYVHNTWTSLDGLPQNSILAIQQTQDGYLWFGTQEGLVRFNGIQFTTFNQANTPGLKQNAITSLLEENGTLWIGTYGGGLTSYTSGVFTSYTTENGLPGNYVSTVIHDKKHNLWIGTNKGLALFKDGHFTRYTGIKTFVEENIIGLAEAPDGSIWGATHTSVFKIDQNGQASPQFQAIIHDPSALAFDPQGKLWIGTAKHGLFVSSEGELIQVRDKRLPQNPIGN